MTSYEFEVIAKNELIKEVKRRFNESLKISEVHLVWFARELKNMKCILCDCKMNKRIYEVTYNGEKDEMYVDIYNKLFNARVESKNFTRKAME